MRMLSTCAERERSVDGGELYERVRGEMVSLVTSLDDLQLATVVDASPDWTVRDTLAHVVGITHDMNRAQFDFGPHWTRRQVEERSGATISEIVAEWDREAPAFEDGLRLFGYEFGSHYVADLHAHMQDVRSALGLSRFDDALVVRVALDFYLASLDEDLRETAGGAVAFTVDDERHVAGHGDPVASVSGASFELLRVLSARRSRSQIRALNWSGDLDAVIETLGRYPLRDAALFD